MGKDHLKLAQYFLQLRTATFLSVAWFWIHDMQAEESPFLNFLNTTALVDSKSQD